MTQPLLALLRATPDAPQVRAAAERLSDTELSALVEQAAQHGLAAVVKATLEAAGFRFPPALAERQKALHAEALACAGMGLRVKSLLFRALDALAAEGIRPVLLKGYGLARRLYAEPLARPMTDVDLLVDVAELPACERALRGLGLSKAEDPGEDDYLAHQHHLVYQGKAGLVELHFRPLSAFGTSLERDAVLDRCTDAELDGRSVRYLSAEDELVYLCLHAAQHLFLRLSWLYDVKLFLEQHPALDVSAAARAAKESGMAAAVYTALFAARTAFRAPVPEALLAGLRPRWWRRALASAAFSEANLVSARLPRTKGPTVVVRTLLSDDLQKMARHAGLGVARFVRRGVLARLQRHRAPGRPPHARP